MKTQCTRSEVYLLKLCFVFLPLFVCGKSFAQLANLTPKTNQAQARIFNNSTTNTVKGPGYDLFGTDTKFIENIGQYGNTLTNYDRMGKILYGYEGLGMPVLFTEKGLIHLQRKTKKPRYEEIERREEKGLKEKERAAPVDRVITMEWVNANTHPQIITEELCTDYFTYGLLQDKAKAYKKITYKELYQGIDLVFSFDENKKAGFKYSLLASPGADLSQIKMKYGADVKSISRDNDGNIFINSGIDKITVSKIINYSSATNNQPANLSLVINKNEISFKTANNFGADNPVNAGCFVSGTGTLSGTDAGKAKDIDYDYAGNVFVSGGGNGIGQKLAKFDANGVLQWTFSGSLSIPMWSFGESHGGWVAEKVSGSLYLGQGIKQSGFRIIRLSTNGLYDNYITDVDDNFVENWKMLWSCNAGVPRIFVAGGGGNPTKELAILSPSSTTLIPSNLTGSSSGHNDISDFLIDPISNDMYSLFSISILSPASDNKIYKHTAPYSNADIKWSVKPGYFNLREPVNRPYLNGLDNSSNTLAINSRYLFYWDGRNLKAFNKSDGAAAGSALTISGNTVLMQGGIVADECNNVFVGSANGVIKVYHFNGNSFDDNAADDITIAGFPSSSVYDLLYNPKSNLLYACGNGFVAAIDVSAYCTYKAYNVNLVSTGCSGGTVTASLNPAAPSGAVVTYKLFEGNTLISANTTGSFTNLISDTRYSVIAVINQACGGLQTETEFNTGSPAILKINNPASICSDDAVDLTDVSITAGSTAGFTFTYWLDAAATIACPSASKAKPGNYYIKAVNSTGCSIIEQIPVAAYPVPKANAGIDTVVCFGTTLQLKGSGGSKYLWSPSTYLDNPLIANPKIINPGTGNITYHLKVTDAFGCQSLNDDVTISFAAPAKILIDNDSLIAINQPLQLNVVDVNNSGFNNYMWSPAYGLNNPFAQNPVAVLDRDMTYTLHASTADHCTDETTINIRVFRGPEFYVPNSFTPNGDGLNDVLKVVPVGMQEFHYLKIFNRFGQLLFETTNPAKGWDGRLNGKQLDYGTFIWIGEGIDYKGNIIQRKGSFILLK